MKIIIHDVAIQSLVTTKKSGHLLENATMAIAEGTDNFLLTIEIDMTGKTFIIDNQFENQKEYIIISTKDSVVRLATVDFTYIEVK